MNSTLPTDTKSPKSALLDPSHARLSRASKAVFTAARIIHDAFIDSDSPPRSAMCTLTYAPEFPWQPKHISSLTSSMSKFAKRHGFKLPYVWVLELTKLGIPHYHILLWLPRGQTLPKPDQQGWWPYGFTRIEWARKPVGYMAKYASKIAYPGTSLPPNARLYGYGGLTPSQRHELRWYLSPRWLRQLVPRGNHIRRETEGWWVDVTHGIRYRTPFLSSWNSFEGAVELKYIGFTIDDVEFI